MHGHYDQHWQSGKDKVNLGIAIVIPAAKILEVINQPIIKSADDNDEKDWREKGMPHADASRMKDLRGFA
jgi:hypothetical protein